MVDSQPNNQNGPISAIQRDDQTFMSVEYDTYRKAINFEKLPKKFSLPYTPVRELTITSDE